ncbi:MAG: UTP--glucose-1-phosphate uridylyltransferase [Proteobacteria bacterium]|nr:UTP--glucose-1-phosphate uridylyltransferase [Pseudomonadota bacterium]
MADFSKIEKIMLSDGSSPNQIALFGDLYRRFVSQQKERIDWMNISSPSEESILNYETLDEVDQEEVPSMLSELAVCRLNGGLGTSMGCVDPKSALEVKNGQSILDLIVGQMHSLNTKYGTSIPLIFMNSFHTDPDTQKIIQKYNSQLPIRTFQQNTFPRLRKDSLMPLSKEIWGQQSDYPPGHGDFYHSLDKSGILDRLIEQGKKYMFVANVDNLGASVDLKILNLIKKTNAPYLMEVTKKTRADVKGGTLIRTSRQPLRLLEIAQVPKNYVEEFKSVKKFKIFNTNNIWINLIELKKVLQQDALHLDVIVNQKTVDHLPILQLETAIGSGIDNFKGSLAVKVPRIRFVPIKKTDDLLLVQSNLFVFEDGILMKNPDRQFEGLPLIRLGESFETVEEYQKRFQSIPDILELDLLTIVGNVYFGKNITLRGNVILVCERGELHIPDQSLLENKVLTGNIKMGEL